MALWEGRDKGRLLEFKAHPGTSEGPECSTKCRTGLHVLTLIYSYKYIDDLCIITTILKITLMIQHSFQNLPKYGIQLAVKNVLLYWNIPETTLLGFYYITVVQSVATVSEVELCSYLTLELIQERFI